MADDTAFHLFRETLAFGLATAETQDVPLWSIDCLNNGQTLRMYVGRKAADGISDCRLLAASLGVAEEDMIEQETETTFSLHSRGPRPFYLAPGAEYTYSGPSVPFGERMIEVQLICSLGKPPEN